jgi:hypothetical protein
VTSKKFAFFVLSGTLALQWPGDWQWGSEGRGDFPVMLLLFGFNYSTLLVQLDLLIQATLYVEPKVHEAPLPESFAPKGHQKGKVTGKQKLRCSIR